MTEVWRPLGVESDEEIAEYDALHDGIPAWMAVPYWAWVREALTTFRGDVFGDRAAMLNVTLWEFMCQMLRITTSNLRISFVDANVGGDQLDRAIQTLQEHHGPLQVADFLLAHSRQDGIAKTLSLILGLSKSAYAIGERAGRPGLIRRVPIGVQVAADSIMGRAGRAGMRLAKAWEELYGLTPDASTAYRLAILAVEDAAVPVVSPQNSRATLGTVLKQLENQAGWSLPMLREHDSAPSLQVVINMMRLLWHGQHDRHGGQPSAPGDVSMEEAQVAVNLAVTLVAWFDAGLVRREVEVN
ncbi:hypothetical protein [Actinoplanes couchii]|uniref:Abortive infection protein-like C-terminal domain-containing protein n=1 Tax=Actinoplanes couchii TaxID=403638 RepID=A0ABQ3XGN3_9ACTN|nr:hypothetical protein [Actinoplanes couchii]MDR6321120.1 hypothetical protein [Actinoplanes couchii]GID57633.1 hypothetical protein Aco03nite_060370 [Actinoplanes couchii]